MCAGCQLASKGAAEDRRAGHHHGRPVIDGPRPPDDIAAAASTWIGRCAAVERDGIARREARRRIERCHRCDAVQGSHGGRSRSARDPAVVDHGQRRMELPKGREGVGDCWPVGRFGSRSVTEVPRVMVDRLAERSAGRRTIELHLGSAVGGRGRRAEGGGRWSLHPGVADDTAPVRVVAGGQGEDLTRRREGQAVAEVEIECRRFVWTRARDQADLEFDREGRPGRDRERRRGHLAVDVVPAGDRVEDEPQAVRDWAVLVDLGDDLHPAGPGEDRHARVAEGPEPARHDGGPVDVQAQRRRDLAGGSRDRDQRPGERRGVRVEPGRGKDVAERSRQVGPCRTWTSVEDIRGITEEARHRVFGVEWVARRLAGGARARDPVEVAACQHREGIPGRAGRGPARCGGDQPGQPESGDDDPSRACRPGAATVVNRGRGAASSVDVSRQSAEPSPHKPPERAGSQVPHSTGSASPGYREIRDR